MIGIDRTTYITYESGLRYYPYDIMQKIADVYNMPLDELLDDYHKFIYNNQGKNIKSIRDELGLKQDELANALDLSLCVIKRAE